MKYFPSNPWQVWKKKYSHENKEKRAMQDDTSKTLVALIESQFTSEVKRLKDKRNLPSFPARTTCFHH